MRNMRFTPCPETQNKMVSSSKGVEVMMVCGLDQSGSQPFNYVCVCKGGCVEASTNEDDFFSQFGKTKPSSDIGAGMHPINICTHMYIHRLPSSSHTTVHFVLQEHFSSEIYNSRLSMIIPDTRSILCSRYIHFSSEVTLGSVCIWSYQMYCHTCTCTL